MEMNSKGGSFGLPDELKEAMSAVKESQDKAKKGPTLEKEPEKDQPYKDAESIPKKALKEAEKKSEEAEKKSEEVKTEEMLLEEAEKLAEDIRKDLKIDITEDDVWDFLFSNKLEKSGVCIIPGKMDATFKTHSANEIKAMSQKLGEALEIKMLENGYKTLNTQHVLAYGTLELGKPGKAKNIGETVEERFEALGEMSGILMAKLGKKWNSFFWLLEFTINKEMDEKKP